MPDDLIANNLHNIIDSNHIPFPKETVDQILKDQTNLFGPKIQRQRLKNMQFNAIIEKDNDGYFAYVPKLKGCVSQGDTMEEALKNIKEAIELYIETLQPDQLAQLKETNYFIAPVEVELAHAC